MASESRAKPSLAKYVLMHELGVMDEYSTRRLAAAIPGGHPKAAGLFTHKRVQADFQLRFSLSNCQTRRSFSHFQSAAPLLDSSMLTLLALTEHVHSVAYSYRLLQLTLRTGSFWN